MVLTYTFLKPYISKICNDFSLHIYIYIYLYIYNEKPLHILEMYGLKKM